MSGQRVSGGGKAGGVEAFKGWCFVAVGKARCEFLSALRLVECMSSLKGIKSSCNIHFYFYGWGCVS